MRKWLCPLVAPLVTAVILEFVSLMSGDWSATCDPCLTAVGPFSTFGLVISIGIPLSYLMTVVFGLPFHLLLKKLRWRSFFVYTLLGVLLGVIALIPFVYFVWEFHFLFADSSHLSSLSEAARVSTIKAGSEMLRDDVWIAFAVIAGSITASLAFRKTLSAA